MMKKNPFFVLFGASGNLSREKIYPALYNLHKKQCTIKGCIGFGRSPLSNDKFRNIIKKSIKSENQSFIKKFSYIQGSYDIKGLAKLTPYIKKKPTIFYFSIPIRIELVDSIIDGMIAHKLINNHTKLVIEKPIGFDSDSAKKLLSTFSRRIGEKQIFLIDHYLAKDMVRNITTLRFANPLFENLWDRENIKSIHIEASEKDGIKNRGEYYDRTGAIRDMIQNHGMQMLSLLTMDQPKNFNFEDVSKSKVRVLKQVRILDNTLNKNIAIGQYKNYRKEKFVSPASNTETSASVTLEINNERWKGVPITISTGKKLLNKKTEIRITFKKNPKCPWSDSCKKLDPNILTINIYPDNLIRLRINSEFNPMKNVPHPVQLEIDFNQDEITKEPYENAILDICNNEKFYIPSFQEVILSWEFIDKILRYVNKKRKILLKKY